MSGSKRYYSEKDYDLDTCYECNNNCLMCTTLRPGYSERVYNQTKKTSDLKRIIDSLNPKLHNFCFTGGEPTIRPDIFELVSYVLDKLPDTRINLITNGRMLAYKNFTEKLISLGLKNYIIPLHAHAPELHDFITQANGSFEQTVKGLKNLLKYDVDVELRIVVHALNYVYLKELAEFINLNFKGISRIVFIYFDLTGTANANRNRLIVNQSKVIPYLENAVDFLASKRCDVRIYHIPLCLLRPDYRKFAEWRTVGERRITFTKECAMCSSKSQCSGIWKTYAHLVGTEEFKAIK